MAKYQITDNTTGHVYEVDAPDDATEKEVNDYAHSHFNSAVQPSIDSAPKTQSNGAVSDFANSAYNGVKNMMYEGANLAEGALSYAASKFPEDRLSSIIMDSARDHRLEQQRRIQEQQKNDPGTFASKAGSVVGELIPYAAGEGVLVNGVGKIAPAAVNAYKGFKNSSRLAGLLGFGAENYAKGAAQGIVTPSAIGESLGDKASSGGVAGLVGGVAGKALSRVASPVVGAAQKKLMDAGVTLTSGQQAGGVLKRVEDAGTSIPVTGSMIEARRREGLIGFNKAVVNGALKPIGVKLPDHIDDMQEASDYLNKAISDKYNQVVPNLHGKIDNQFNQELAHIFTRELPKAPLEVQHDINNFISSALGQNRTPGNQFDGKTAQRIRQDLQRKLSNYSNANGSQADARDIYAMLNNSWNDLLERQGTAASKEFKATNRAFQNAIGVNAAMDSAKVQGHVFTPAQLTRGLASIDKSANNKKFTSGNVPYADLKELASAGQKVLPSSIGNSGTAERTLANKLIGLGTGAGTAAYFHALLPAAAAIGLSSAAYTKTGQKILNNRPQVIRSLAPYLERYSAPLTAEENARQKKRKVSELLREGQE